MARKTKAQLEVPGTESPDRIEELHALGLEIYDLQEKRKSITKEERQKRQVASATLKDHKIDHYHVDGVEVWAEPGGEKIKVKLDGNPEDEE